MTIIHQNGEPWRQQYQFNSSQSADVTGWSYTAQLCADLYDSAVVVTNSKVYLLGGRGADTQPTAAVQVADISSGGILDGGEGAAFSLDAQSLPSACAEGTAVITKDRVYFFAGYGKSVVYTAPIDSGGTIGTWATATSPTTSNLWGVSVCVFKDRMYVLGSVNSAKVYSCPIGTDGVIGTWVEEADLPDNLGFSQVVTTEDRIYLIGGYRDFSTTSVIFYAPVTLGSIGAWVWQATGLPDYIQSSQSVITDDTVYLFGGSVTGSVGVTTVYKAPIVSGVIGTWSATTSLPVAVHKSQLIVTSSMVYLLGGKGSNQDKCYSASFAGGFDDYLPLAYFDGIPTITGIGNLVSPISSLRGGFINFGTGNLVSYSPSLSGVGVVTNVGKGRLFSRSSVSGVGTSSIYGTGDLKTPISKIQAKTGSGGNLHSPMSRLAGQGSVTITGSGNLNTKHSTLSASGVVAIQGYFRLSGRKSSLSSSGIIGISGNGSLITPKPKIDATAFKTITGVGNLVSPMSRLSGKDFSNTSYDIITYDRQRQCHL